MTSDELRFISILENLTGAVPRDCVWIADKNRVIFVIESNDVGKVIGIGGSTIDRVRQQLKKTVEIVEYSSEPEKFLQKCLAPARISKVSITKKRSQKQAIVTVKSSEKGKAIGKNGRNIERSRLLMKRHFNIDNVIIST